MVLDVRYFFVKFAISFCKFQAAVAQEVILGEHQISYLKDIRVLLKTFSSRKC